MNKSKFKFLVKLLITIFFICLILTKVDLANILYTLLKINLWFILPIFIISFIMIEISCLKWQLFLSASKINLSIKYLTAYYLIGYFFNNLLPSNIGGDLVRSYLLGKDVNDQARTFSSVFLERLTGLIALLLVGIIAVIFNIKLLQVKVLLFSFIIMSIILTGIVLFCFTERFGKIFLSFFDFKLLASFKPGFEKIYKSIYFFRNQRNVLIFSMIYSFGFHLMAIFNTLVCCWSIGLYPKIIDTAVIVPMIMLISVIPISVGSIGLWEGAFAYFFYMIGISPAESISVALILRGKNLILGLVGGSIFLVRGKYFLKKEIVNCTGKRDAA